MIGPTPPPTKGESASNTKLAGAGAVRRATIGPSPKPPTAGGADLVRLAAAAQAEKDRQQAQAEKVDTAAVAACKKGELPSKGWATRWNAPTKRQALVAALEANQMHVVYALRPRSEAFQESMGAVAIEQAELDRLLKLHAAKPKAQDVVAWLLEEGASIEALCAADDSASRASASALVSKLSEDPVRRAAQLRRHADWRVRATAAEIFALHPKEAATEVDSVAELLEDDEPVVRSSGVGALGRIGVSAASACVKKLHAEKAKTREAAADAMGKIGAALDDDSIIALADLLEDSHWQVPSAAANALKRIGAPAAAHVARVLSKCTELSQPVAAEALARIGGTSAADAAALLLTSQHAGVRAHAAQVLGEVGMEAASPHMDALKPLANDDADRDVRRAAAKALLHLGGKRRPAAGEAAEDLGDELPDFNARRDKGKGNGKGKGGKGKGAGGKGGGNRSRSRSRERRR